MTLVCSFPPVARRDARVLILGSMPGVASLRAQQYYAHPRNAFWPIIAELTGCAADAPYAERLAALTGAHIALWDVLKSCIRVGSLDTAIDEASIVPNDFTGFLRAHRQITHVLFNGSKAAAAFRRHVRPDLAEEFAALDYQRLPSTSPANASCTPSRKLALWRAAVTAAVSVT